MSEHFIGLFPEIDAVCRAGKSPLMAWESGGPRQRVYFVLPLPSDTTDLEAVRQAIQSHYEEKYGNDVLVRAERLCSSTWDEEDQTDHHLLTVEAACQHGLSARTVVEVVLPKAALQE